MYGSLILYEIDILYKIGHNINLLCPIFLLLCTFECIWRLMHIRTQRALAVEMSGEYCNV